MIRLDGVWKSHQGTPALRGVSLDVAKGDALLLTGPSGAGKTTLLELVFVAERPDRGEVYVAGRSVGRLRASSIPFVRRNIGVVFQDFKLLEARSAVENVAVALRVLGLGRDEIRERSLGALEAVGLGSRADARVAALSGGEQQRVAVARAIVAEPAILLCDEPTGNLDPVRAGELLALIERIHRRGTTVVMATHDPEVVDFGIDAGWRRARLVDGELLDVDLPLGRSARLDDETEGFTAHKDDDDSLEIEIEVPLLKVVP